MGLVLAAAAAGLMLIAVLLALIMFRRKAEKAADSKKQAAEDSCDSVTSASSPEKHAEPDRFDAGNLWQDTLTKETKEKPPSSRPLTPAPGRARAAAAGSTLPFISEEVKASPAPAGAAAPAPAPEPAMAVAAAAAAAAAPTPNVRVVLTDWDGEGTSGEGGGYLLLPGGARIEVITEGEPGGWWEGRLGDKTGWFPVAYTEAAAPPAVEERAVEEKAVPIAADAPADRPNLPRSFSMMVIDAGLRKSLIEPVAQEDDPPLTARKAAPVLAASPASAEGAAALSKSFAPAASPTTKVGESTIAEVDAEAASPPVRQSVVDNKPKREKRYTRAIRAWHGEGWDGAADGFLSFEVGTRIEVVREGKLHSWWLGRLNGKKGWFPSGYCKLEAMPSSPTALLEQVTAAEKLAARVSRVLETTSQPTSPQKEATKEPTSSQKASASKALETSQSLPSASAATASRPASTTGAAAAAAAAATPAIAIERESRTGQKKRAALGVGVAKRSWTGEGWVGDISGCLTFSAGTRIEIVRQGDPGGWWLGRLNGKKGWFPSSYCTIEKAEGGEAWRRAAAVATGTGGAGGGEMIRRAAALAANPAASKAERTDELEA